MRVVFGIACLSLGTVLVVAACAFHRDPAASPRLVRWVAGETAGVLLTLVPASGIVALINFMIDENVRHISVLEGVAAILIAAAGWVATNRILRRVARLEEAHTVAEVAAVVTPPTPPHSTPNQIIEERAA